MCKVTAVILNADGDLISKNAIELNPLMLGGNQKGTHT